MGATRTIQEKKKGRARDPFVMIPCRWMDMPAWAHLSGNAVKLLLHLIRLSGGDNGAGGERGELFLSERSAAKAIGVVHNTASAAFELLIEAGWVRPVRQGYFAVKAGEKELRATVWRLTFQPHPQTRRGPTLEFRDWLPEENCRAQKLNGSGSKIDALPDRPAISDAKIEPVAPAAPSERENLDRSIIEPHLDIAKGRRSEGHPKNSGRTRPTQNEPALIEPIRARVEAHWSTLDPRGRAAFAKSVNLLPDEVAQFVAGRFVPAPGKQMDLRAKARIAA